MAATEGCADRAIRRLDRRDRLSHADTTPIHRRAKAEGGRLISLLHSSSCIPACQMVLGRRGGGGGGGVPDGLCQVPRDIRHALSDPQELDGVLDEWRSLFLLLFLPPFVSPPPVRLRVAQDSRERRETLLQSRREGDRR